MVSRGRFHSAIDNPGSAFAPPSPAIAVQVAFLQNTLEQAVAAVGAHLALATLISGRSEEHTSELQSLMRISYAVFCLKKKKQTPQISTQRTCSSSMPNNRYRPPNHMHHHP